VPDVGQVADACIEGEPQIEVSFDSNTVDLNWRSVRGYLRQHQSALMSVLHHAGGGSVRIVDVGQSTPITTAIGSRNLVTPVGKVFEEKLTRFS
jgi:hypothetical protein